MFGQSDIQTVGLLDKGARIFGRSDDQAKDCQTFEYLNKGIKRKDFAVRYAMSFFGIEKALKPEKAPLIGAFSGKSFV